MNAIETIMSEMLNPTMIRVLPENTVAKVGDIIARPETEEDRQLARVQAEIEKARIEKLNAKSVKHQSWLIKKASLKTENQRKEAERAEKRRIKKEQRKAKEAAEAEQRAEADRRRKANPGNGSAAISARAFMGIDCTNEKLMKVANEIIDLTALIEAVDDSIEAKREERLALRSKLGWQKVKINDVSAGLKDPKKSSKYRAAITEYQLIEQQINDKTGEIRELNKQRIQYISDKADAKMVIRGSMNYGDPAERAVAKAANKIVRKTFKVVKGKAAKMREAKKVKEKEKLEGFSIRTFSGTNVLTEYLSIFSELNNWRPYRGTDDKIRAKNMAKRIELSEKAAELIHRCAEDYNKPYSVKKNTGRVTRLSKSLASAWFGIDVDDPKVHEQWIVVELSIQELFHPHWMIFSDEEKEGLEKIEKIQKVFQRRYQHNGIVVGDKQYNIFAASAAHQKKERSIATSRELNENLKDVIWFGTTESHIINEMKVDGAEIWKSRANIIRPYVATLTHKDGTAVTLPRCLVVKDVSRLYVHENGIEIGGNHNGKRYRKGRIETPTLLGDGMAIALTELNLYGQFTGYGLKGCIVDGKSALEAFCKKHNISDWRELMVEDVDGNMVRLGDYDIIFGVGCWKFDKYHVNWTAYTQKVAELVNKYPGLDKIRILRQIDDAEGEEKVRRLTRSLIQQWVYMRNNDVKKLTERTINSLRERETFEGIFGILAELNVPEEDRSPLAKLFMVAPWLILNENVQQWLCESWMKKRNEAMANKLRTSGQYPYIVQDPVAMLEVWVLGLDPNSDDLGVLKAGQISLDRVPDGEEVLAVRFPANFQTAKVLTNVACLEAFASCGNVAVLSIYDDILIRQDGDVDGDEMCIIYDKLAIALTKRMIRDFDPPVVIFAHGDGVNLNKTIPGSKAELNKKMADALWRAKHFDKVGEYANCARDCAYLASIAYEEGKMDQVDRWLLAMAAASTGAILAIDQVKGNQIDESLVSWIESIEKAVNKAMDYKSPRTQAYLKGISLNECLGWSKACTDKIGQTIEENCPEYKFYSEGYDWNREAAWRALVGNRELTSIRTATVQNEVLTSLSQNYFQEKMVSCKPEEMEEYELDSKTLDAIKHNQPVGQKELAVLFWHNSMALSSKLEGRTLQEKSEEYYPMVFDCLCKQANASKYVHKDGHPYTEDEINDLVAIYLAVDGLEMHVRNGKVLDNQIYKASKGKWVRFCLRIAAERLTNIIRNSGVTLYDFLAFHADNGTPDCCDAYEATSESVMNREYLQTDEEYYDYPEQEEYVPTDEELEAMAVMYN